LIYATALLCSSWIIDATGGALVTQKLLQGGLPLEIDGGEGREGQDKGMGAALGGLIDGFLAAGVADVRTAIVGGVGVHDFTVVAGIGDTEAIAAADDGSGVDDGDDYVSGILAATNEGENAVVGIVGVNPFKTVPVELDLVEGGFGGVKMIEIRDELLDAAVGLVFEQMPVETVGFAPFVALGKFLAHEEKFLAGMGILIGVEEPEVGELLPHIAGHFVEKRVFSVDDFVVREGKKEILGESVEQGESELVVFVFAMDGVVGEIFQGVVHPAHVPFETETQASKINGARDGGPGSGFLGDGEDAGEFLVGDLVHALDEINGVEIFAAAELIGNPLAGLA
jgi:hypothetical protein